MKTKLLLLLVLGFVFSVVQAQEDPFAGRSTTAGPDVASSKENVPVKKETFSAKIERYKKEGFKVAMVLNSGPIKTIAPPATAAATTSASSQFMLEGSLPSMHKEMTPLLEELTSKLNEEFNTDIFEIVDMSKIPYKEAKIGKVDAWDQTIYRMVITLYATPAYDYNKFGSKYSASLKVNMNATGLEWTNEKGKVKIKYPIRTGNLGNYTSSEYESETDPNFKFIDDVQAAVDSPRGDALVAQLQQIEDENLPKFIEKLKK